MIVSDEMNLLLARLKSTMRQPKWASTFKIIAPVNILKSQNWNISISFEIRYKSLFALLTIQKIYKY